MYRPEKGPRLAGAGPPLDGRLTLDGVARKRAFAEANGDVEVLRAAMMERAARLLGDAPIGSAVGRGLESIGASPNGPVTEAGTGEEVQSEAVEAFGRSSGGRPPWMPFPGALVRVHRLRDGYPVAAAFHGEVDPDYSGRCTRPVPLHVFANVATGPDGATIVERRGYTAQGGGQVSATVSCGKCEACLDARRTKWFGRACREVGRAWARDERAFVLTLTFKHEPADRDAVVAEVQLYLDRLQKGLKGKVEFDGQVIECPRVKVRYILAIERGEEHGRLHAHLLVMGKVNKRQLRVFWTAGFSKAKMVHKDHEAGRPGWLAPKCAAAVGYVIKYLTKSDGRICASQHFGEWVPDAFKAATQPVEGASPTSEAGSVLP